jgi:hypothetical protein
VVQRVPVDGRDVMGSHRVGELSGAMVVSMASLLWNMWSSTMKMDQQLME